MSYLDVISLDEMLTYLRIDDEQNETDVEITSMLSAAFRYIERHTNTIIKQENRMYPVVNGSVLVYDKPINSIVTEGVTKETYSSFCELRTVQKEVEISVGYENPCDVPSGLKEVAKVLVKLMYFEQETNKSFKELMPAWAILELDTQRSFI